MKDWLHDLMKALLVGAGGAAAVFLPTLLIGFVAGGSLADGLEAAKTALLLVASLGMFLLAGMLLLKGKKPEASAMEGWRRHFRAAGVKAVLAVCCLAFVLAAAVVDSLL